MKEKIKYTIRDSILGLTLLATSDKGLCAVLIDKSSDRLVDDLKARFPEANLEKQDTVLEKLAQDVVIYINNPKDTFEGTLDIRGTDFQQKVWNQLCKIPRGKTSSYKDIAHSLRLPGAARAVAKACAANMIAVIIPCHRVIKSDGGISGYRWGVDCKKQLLTREGAL